MIQQPPDKVSQLYSALKKQNIKVPETEMQFRNSIQNRTTAENLYVALKKLNYKLPENSQGFYDSLFPPSKKKDSSEPSSTSSRSSDRPSFKTPDLFDTTVASDATRVVTPTPEESQKLGNTALRDRLLNIAPKMSAMERAGSAAGYVNQAVLKTFSSMPKTVAIAAQQLDRLTGQEKPIEEYATYQAGQWLEDKALEYGLTATDPRADSFLETTVPSALGSVLGIMLTGRPSTAGGEIAVNAPKGVLGKVGKEVGDFVTSPQAFAGGSVLGVTEFEQAKAAGASDEEAWGVFLKNYGVGQTEVLPIARMLSRVNKISGGSIMQVLKAGGVGSLEEGAQEGIQQYLTNKIAQGSYDPAREPWRDMIESMGAGMFVGFILPGVITAMNNMTPEQKAQTRQELNTALKDYQAQKISQPAPTAQADPVREALMEKVNRGEALTDSEIETLEEQNYTQSGIKQPQQPEIISDRVQPVEKTVDETVEKPTVAEFVERIKSGEQIASPEDLQFYENNKEEIESVLQSQVQPATEPPTGEQPVADTPEGKEQPVGGVSEQVFVTSKNERVSGERLAIALNRVADDHAETARKIREEDEYADHVTEAEKDQELTKGLETAEKIRRGELSNALWVAQRINTELTGEEVPILPPVKKTSQKGDKPQIGSRVEIDWIGSEKTGTVEEILPDGRYKVRSDDGTIYRVKKIEKVLGTTTKTVGFVQPSGLNFKLPFNFFGGTQQVAKFFAEWFRPRGLMPQSMFDIVNQKKAKTASEMLRMKMYVGDLESAIKKDFGDNPDLELINSVLQGDAPTANLPETTRAAVRQLRDHITMLQQRGIADGVFTGDLVAVIEESVGTYLTRSYKVHDTPKEWLEFLKDNPEGQAIMNQAEAFVRSKMPKATDEEVAGILNEILYNPDAPLAILKGGKLGSKDLGILRKRKDIAPEIRALMGEWKDPFVNYSKTIVKMANLVNNHNLQKQMRADGLGKYFFEKPVGKYFAKIAPTGSEVMDALTEGKDLYTTPEIAKIIEEFNSHDKHGWIWQQIVNLNAWAKVGKTVLSTSTHARNFEANALFYLANGYVFDKTGFSSFSTATKNIVGKLFELDNKALREQLIKYAGLEVIGGSVQAGELKSYINNVYRSKDDPTSFLQGRIKQIRNKALSKVADLYAAEDEFWRIVAYETELARYRDAFAGDSAYTEERLQRMAADRVIKNLPTYSRAPKIVRELGKTVFIAPFATFSAEVVRSGYNTIESIKEEWKDERTRPIAMKRAAGVLAAIAVVEGIKAASQYSTGVSDEEDEAISKLDSPWSSRSKAYLEKQDDGNYRYIDIGYTDPYTYIREPIKIMFNSIAGKQNLEEAAIESLGILSGPYLNEGLLTQRLIDLKRNQDQQGYQVWNPQLPIEDKLRQMSDYLWKGFEPGTVRSARRVIQSQSGELNQYGKEVNVADELMFAIGGQRTETFSPEQAARNIFKYEIKKKLEQSENIYTDLFYKKGPVDPQAIEKAKELSKEALQRNLNKAKEIYQAAILLGVPQSRLLQIMKETKIDKFDVGYIVYDKPMFRPQWNAPKANQVRP